MSNFPTFIPILGGEMVFSKFPHRTLNFPIWGQFPHFWEHCLSFPVYLFNTCVSYSCQSFPPSISPIEKLQQCCQIEIRQSYQKILKSYHFWNQTFWSLSKITKNPEIWFQTSFIAFLLTNIFEIFSKNLK